MQGFFCFEYDYKTNRVQLANSKKTRNIKPTPNTYISQNTKLYLKLTEHTTPLPVKSSEVEIHFTIISVVIGI